MSIETIIYLAYVIPNIGALLTLGSIIFFIVAGIVSLMKRASAENNQEKIEAANFSKKYFLNNLKWMFLAAIVACFIPSEPTIYLMLGANYLKNSTLPSKVELAIEKKIDSYLADDKEKK
jgi:predicted membrane protein